jgi:putative sterol carrier protein
MSMYESKEQAVAVFGRLFSILLEDETFSEKLRARNLSLRLVQTKPDFELFVDETGVFVDVTDRRAAISVKMSCDTAHNLWMGKLLMPAALATGRVRVKGNVARVLEFVPLLHPAFDVYPSIASEAGLPA